ncbi:MAG: ABC transporter permease, partial [Myxococcales bacterium]|nr:ABC transporter permease [Myxococcales bacterium]
MRGIALGILIAMLLVAVFADVIASSAPVVQGEDWTLWSPIRSEPGDVRTNGKLEVLRRPSAEHWLGTDDRGRDVAARLVHGSRATLVIAAACALLASFAAIVLALLACWRPWLDWMVQSLCDVVAAVPTLLLVLLVRGLVGAHGIVALILLISLPRAAATARIVRDSLRGALAQPYCEAACALGVSRSRLLVRHALPASYSQLATAATLTASTAVLAEVALSFLGLGLPGATPSWGELLRQAHENQLRWWLLLPAGAATTSLAWALSSKLGGD